MIALMTAAGVSLLFTLFMTPVFIRIFRKVGWGQFIREDGPQSHHAKHGTPTMGGIVVIVGSVIAYFLGHLLGQQPVTASGLLVLFMMVGLGLVGFIDDFIKTHKHRSLGLGGVAKIIGQIVVAVAFAVIALQLPNSAGELPASTNVSFIRDFNVDFLVWGAVGVALFLLWISLITVATSNAVNVTDGLDGLATGSLIMGIGAYIIIGFWQFNQSCVAQLDPAVADRCYDTRDPLDLAIVAAAIVGGLIGFLWWNTSPAQIFMGDTGSLGLGGAMAALAILSRTELLIILLGGIFVISAGSVIIQRIYFKLTHGKRIFRMSPLHHHFELKGWAEVTVVVRFWIIGGLCVATGVGLFYLEWLAG